MTPTPSASDRGSRLAAASWIRGGLPGLLLVALALFPAPGRVDDLASLPPVGDLPPGLAEAARAGDWPAVRDTLRPRADSPGPRGELARTLLGLHAHRAERIDEARQWLDRAPGAAPGPLEDWSLWILADCLVALDERPGARDALDEILRLGSPALEADARVRSAELAALDGDLVAARRHVERGRGLDLTPTQAERLERVAWDLATREGREETVLDVGRRIVVRFPALAEELRVRRWLGLPADRPWEAWLEPGQAVERARVLGELGDVEAAWATLRAVPDEARDREWTTTAFATRVAAGDGRGALDLVEAAPPEARPEGAEAEWTRARALLLAARPRPRDPLSSRQRDAMRREATSRLENAARLAADPALRGRALAQLFEELAAEERIDDALAVRERILAEDPTSDVGRTFLWERGWRELEDRNPTGAIGYFTRLAAEPRQDRLARGARYWLARSWERLGEVERARALDEELARSPVTDFYHRHAERRLGSPPTPAPTTPAAPWPDEPLLARARFLTDAGLDVLASHEIEGLAKSADPVAADALRALILAREGRARDGMTPLYRAFPSVATAVQDAVPLAARRLYYPRLHADSIERAAADHGLSPWLVYAIVRQESAFDARATSRSGARGLMQLMTPTARELAARAGIAFTPDRLWEPDVSLALGTRYLRQVVDMFDGDLELALAGYNGGPYRIKRWWNERGRGVGTDRFVDRLPLAETRIYVQRVLLLSDSYRVLYAGE